MLLWRVGVSSIIVLLLLILYILIRFLRNETREKKIPFECGFIPLRTRRSAFSTRFFLLVVIFLVFDVEVVLLFPILAATSIETSYLIFGFLSILLVGVYHEWNEGALNWSNSKDKLIKLLGS